jgi:hypothetical protein
MLSTKVGPVTVLSLCPPDVVLDGLGFILACPAGGVIVNGSTQRVAVTGQVQAIPGHAMAAGAPCAIQATLAPKAHVALAAPPAGGEWVVEVVSRRSAMEIGVGVLGAGALVLGLAGVGVADIVQHLRGRRRKRR